MLLKKSHAMLFEFLLAAAALGAVAGQLIYFLGSPRATGQTTGAAMLLFFSYFTVLTNLLVGTTLLGRLWLKFRPHAAPVRWLDVHVPSACVIYILLVGIVYETLLRPLAVFTGLGAVTNFLLHDFVPVVYLLYWFLGVRKGELRPGHVPVWLAYPLVYTGWSLVRGAYTGRYPYPFFDALALGYPRVALNCAVLALGLVAAGIVLVAVDTLLARRGIGV
jgi:hypothetical protein